MILHTFSMPPVAEKQRRVRKRVDFLIGLLVFPMPIGKVID